LDNTQVVYRLPSAKGEKFSLFIGVNKRRRKNLLRKECRKRNKAGSIVDIFLLKCFYVFYFSVYLDFQNEKLYDYIYIYIYIYIISPMFVLALYCVLFVVSYAFKIIVETNYVIEHK